jgi:hypothetical protein
VSERTVPRSYADRCAIVQISVQLSFLVASVTWGTALAWAFKDPGQERNERQASGVLPPVRVSPDGSRFVVGPTEELFLPWGFNYLGKFGELAEESWHTPEGWQRLVDDFKQMKALGANVVRWHLQFPTYMQGPDAIDEAALQQLKSLLALAQDTGLYLDLTGLNLYRKAKVPAWYDQLQEPARWEVQAKFWKAIARVAAGNSAVFCYDLVNEPVIGEPREGEHPWILGELGGFYFVQRIAYNRARRPAEEVAAEWLRLLRAAIREEDQRTLITVGVIPWAFVWKGARPIFYSPAGLPYLDFVSIHVYPRSGRLKEELEALAVYDLGKPLVIEEIFPLACSIEELDEFIDAASGRVDGWISHYFGHSPDEHRKRAEPAGELTARFLEYWRAKGLKMVKSLSEQQRNHPK